MYDSYVNSVVFTTMAYIISGGVFWYKFPRSSPTPNLPNEVLKVPVDEISFWSTGDLECQSPGECVSTYYSNHGILMPFIEFIIFWFIAGRITRMIVRRFLHTLAMVMDYVPVGKSSANQSELKSTIEEEFMEASASIGVSNVDEEVAEIQKEIELFKEILFNNNVRMRELQNDREEEEKKILVIKERCIARATALKEGADTSETNVTDTTQLEALQTETIQPAELTPPSILKTGGFTALKHVTFKGQGDAIAVNA